MARRSKELAAVGFPQLRKHWQKINCLELQAQAEQRAKWETAGKKRAKCRCAAYKFPHRPRGGLCRYPDPPAVRWQDARAAEIAAGMMKLKEQCGEPTAEQMANLITSATKPSRPYRDRYAGIRRQIARNNGLHPIRDRDAIEAIIPAVLPLAKQLHRLCPKYKYRNMEITATGLRGNWQTAGPMM